MTVRDQRLRDPVHGLIVFRGSEPLDQLAWRLLDTPEFQRLRRIRQLGVSEFVFPSATHTRFAHCVGVFHTARQLIRVIEREISGIDQTFSKERAEVAVIAALLHDLGHGPLSHTFEGVQKSRGVKKKHEKWSAEIVRNPAGAIQPLLDGYREGLADEIASMLEKEDPDDIYHAVVSSSFDADRLDYLRRDRLMTGTHAGAIDFDWLMEHVRVRPVALEEPDADESAETELPMVPTFCLDRKALPAAEQFLLARYTLHEQVYFHKTTRCVEAMVAKLLTAVAALAKGPDASDLVGLPPGNPLLAFFAQDEPTIEHYLSLDDIVLWGAVEAMTRAGDSAIAELAGRLRARRLFKTLGLESVGADEGRQRHRARLIDEHFDVDLKAGSVIKDEGAKASIYTQIGGDDDRMHKKLHVLDGAKAREITELSRVIEALATPKCFTRYYFENESNRETARNLRRERK
jgi:HD superfamily phosphohydrolase